MNDRKYNKKAMIALGVGAACILIFVAVQNINLVVRALGWINNLFLPLTLGFGLAMILFAGLREQLSLNDVPKAFKGIPIALVTAGILAMAFMGFSGLV